MEIDLGDVNVIAGRQNTGKSVLIEHLATQMDRVVIIDNGAEHWPPGAVSPESPVELLKLWSKGETVQVVRSFNPVEFIDACTYLTDFHLIIDEASIVMDEHSLPESLEHFAEFHCSHQNCSLTVGLHQIKLVNDRVESQADNYFIFKYGNHYDSKFKKLPLTDEDLSKLNSLRLEEYKFLLFQDKGGGIKDIRGPVPMPEHLK